MKSAQKLFKQVNFQELELIETEEQKDEKTEIKSENKFLKQTLKKIGEKLSNYEEEQKKVGEESKEDSNFALYAHMNQTEEDYTFLLTALYCWESVDPTFSKDFSSDPATIRQKAQPKKQEEKKAENEGDKKPEGEEGKKEEGEKKNEEEGKKEDDIRQQKKKMKEKK